ncbi:unnamed protein product [Umbelopsis vinacea]
MKDARSAHIQQRRENQWLQQMIQQEWNKFRRENEIALKLEAAHVTENLEAAIEENLFEELQESYNPTWDELMQLEEDELADAFENYQLEISAELPETTHIPTALTMEQTSEPIAHTCHACKAGTLSTVNLEFVHLAVLQLQPSLH